MPEDTGVSEAFDNSVAIVGSAMVVGTFGLEGTASSAGRAYVFTKTAAGSDETEFFASDIGINDGFGNSVAITGNTIVVGAPGAGAPEHWSEHGPRLGGLCTSSPRACRAGTRQRRCWAWGRPPAASVRR